MDNDVTMYTTKVTKYGKSFYFIDRDKHQQVKNIVEYQRNWERGLSEDQFTREQERINLNYPMETKVNWVINI